MSSLSGRLLRINLNQAEEDFDLQLALVLQVAVVAAVDDPDLAAWGPHGNKVGCQVSLK